MVLGHSMSREEKRLTIKNVIITLLVIAFFAGIIFIYYRMLYEEKENSIIKSGERTAGKAVDQFEKYLSTNIDSIKLTAYSLDEMITDKRKNSEIQDFLIKQSTAIKNAVSENSTGLYGYINGRFFSGTNWIPPEDFDATERPWYTKPMENKDRITILEPYTDLQSGKSMLALGKSLCDGVSVVSVDVSLDQIQKLTEDAVRSGGSDIEMILNDDGIVVAHSDFSEFDKNYSTEEDTLGAAIFDNLNNVKNSYFELNYDGAHYVVYVAGIQNGWYCLSVKDATGVFGMLNIMLGLTIAAIIAVVVIISIIMTNSNRRRLTLERLSERLSSTADIYISMHEIDFLNDTFSEVSNSKEEASDMIGDTRNNCQEMINMIMEQFTDQSTKEDILEFVDFGTLDERLKHHNTITTEFLSSEGEWRRARFIVSDRLADGRVSRALYLIEDIDEEIRNHERLTETAIILGSRMSSIANIYMTVYELNVETDSFIEIKADTPIVDNLIGKTRVHAQEMLNKVMENVCDGSCVYEVLRFVNLSTLIGRLRDTDTVAMEYINKQKQWRRGRFIASRRDDNGRILRILWLVEDIDNEKKERDKLIDMSERAIAANEAKSSFISNISKEIHTPINAIIGMNEMILRECEDENVITYSKSIRKAGNTLLGLVDDMLDYSKSEEDVPKKEDSNLNNDTEN